MPTDAASLYIYGAQVVKTQHSGMEGYWISANSTECNSNVATIDLVQFILFLDELLQAGAVGRPENTL